MSILVCLVGAQASGKSTLEKWIDETFGIPRVISHTTRPKREGERDDEYHFVCEHEFDDLRRQDGGFIETREYKVANGETWYYGLHRSAVFAPVHIAVVDYKGFCEIRAQYDVIGIHMYVSKEESIRRIIEFRPGYDMAEADRRFESDIVDLQIPAQADPLMFQIVSQPSVEETREQVVKILNLATKLGMSERTLGPVGSIVLDEYETLPVDFYLTDLESKFTKINLDDYYLSYSGGRDSHFLFWFITEYMKKEVKVYSFNTYMEHEDILRRMKQNADQIFLPKMKPGEIKEKYGSPTFTKFQDEMISRYQNGNRSENTMRFINGDNVYYNITKKAKDLLMNTDLHKVSNKCCKILKKDINKRIKKETGLLPIVAVRAEESANRKNAYKSCFTKDGMFTPIFDLTDDLLQAIENQYDIEVPEIYNHIDRTGCMGCPYAPKANTVKELKLVSKNRRQFLVKHYEETYRATGILDEIKDLLEEDKNGS